MRPSACGATVTSSRRRPPTEAAPAYLTVRQISDRLGLGDSGRVLVGRMILLRLTRSFYGVENHQLTDKLLTELPGILLWAIEGWSRLQERGRFVQPESGQQMLDDMDDLSSPINAFDTLTTDLCIAAVNSRPKALLNFGEERQVKLKLVVEGFLGSSWEGRIGDVVREFVKFDSYKNTREGYDQLFRGTKIVDAIKCEAAMVASLVRNQITHDGGIVTANFIAEAKKLKAEPWQSAAAGALLPLDGKNVSALSEGVVQCANGLIRAVDDWLKPRAKQAPKSSDQDQ